MHCDHKIILDLCGGTGAWSKPYRDAGFDVRLITLPDNDIRTYIPPDGVYGVLAAPPCTEFSFAKHYHGKGNYSHDFRGGLEVVAACCRIILFCKPAFWAIENPHGYLQRFLGKPNFVFNPYDFGDPYKKRTHLWGKFVRPVGQAVVPVVTKFSMLHSRDIHPEFYGKLTRQERRAITPAGFSTAFFEANK